MNAFARSNLAVALLRLQEARGSLETVGAFETLEACRRGWGKVDAAAWAVREAMSLIENACAVDEMESADTLPMPPESGARRMG